MMKREKCNLNESVVLSQTLIAHYQDILQYPNSATPADPQKEVAAVLGNLGYFVFC